MRSTPRRSPGITGYALQELRPGADPTRLQAWRTAYVWLYAQWGRELLDHAASAPDDGQPGHNLWKLAHEVAGRRLVAWGRADVPAGAVEVKR